MNEIKERSGSKKEKEHLIIKRKCGGLYIAPQVSSNSEGHPTPPLGVQRTKRKKSSSPAKKRAAEREEQNGRPLGVIK